MTYRSHVHEAYPNADTQAQTVDWAVTELNDEKNIEQPSMNPRYDMRERVKDPRYTGVERRSAPQAASAAKPKLASEPPPEKPGGRHGAIRHNAPNIRSYRRWRDSVKAPWENENK